MNIFVRLFRLEQGTSLTAGTALAHVRRACYLYEQQAHLAAASAGLSMEESNHLSLTSSSPRQPVLADARIREVRQITPSVKRLRLHVDDERFGFQPGQWVDFHAPGVATIGGYSIVSSPSQLKCQRTCDIAVKESRHPPALWVHTQAAAGLPVKLQVGGDFVLGDADLERPLLFLAGGIGITPIMAMLSSFVEMVPSLLKQDIKASATLLYSASSIGELAFRSELDELRRRSLGTLEVTYFVTRGAAEDPHGQHVQMEYRRMHNVDVTHAWQRMSASPTQGEQNGPVTFLCGPSGMVDHFLKHAQAGLKIPSCDLRSEQWW